MPAQEHEHWEISAAVEGFQFAFRAKFVNAVLKRAETEITRTVSKDSSLEGDGFLNCPWGRVVIVTSTTWFLLT